MKLILFWCPGNIDLIHGSTDFMKHTLEILGKLDNMRCIFLSGYILKNETVLELKNQNIEIILPNKFQKNKLMEDKQLIKIIKDLDKHYQLEYIFIRSINLVKNYKNLFEVNDPLLKKIIIFLWYDLLAYINADFLNTFNYFLFSNQYVQNCYMQKYQEVLKSKKAITYLPIIKIPKLQVSIDFSQISCCYAGTFIEAYCVEEFINYFNKHPNINFNIYGRDFPYLNLISNTNIKYCGVLYGDNLDEALIKNQFGLSIRKGRYDHHLDISAKLIKYMSLGILPIVNKSDINVKLLGNDYFFCDKIENIGIVINKFIKNTDLTKKFIKRNLITSSKYSLEYHIPLMNTFLN